MCCYILVVMWNRSALCPLRHGYKRDVHRELCRWAYNDLECSALVYIGLIEGYRLLCAPIERYI